VQCIFRLITAYSIDRTRERETWGRVKLRQNIGLFLLTLGSIILGVSVFRLYLIKFYQLEWKKIPWEVRLFCKSIGIRNREKYFKKLLINKKEYVLPDEELKFRDRISSV